MGLLPFLSKMFRSRNTWNGTPEMFLALVIYLQKKNNAAYAKKEVLQWGEVLQKVIRVNLHPYRDFRDLLERGEPDFSMVEQLDNKISERHHRIELKKAIYGEHVDLGDDDLMTSNSDSAIFARKFVEDLSKHVQFPEEEPREQNDL